MTEGRTRDEDNKERDKCGDTVPAGEYISAGKVSGLGYTAHAADSGGAHSRISGGADPVRLSRLIPYQLLVLQGRLTGCQTYQLAKDYQMYHRYPSAQYADHSPLDTKLP